MEFNSIEDIKEVFPDEISGSKWFSKIRWGEWASCPYCGNKKAYFIEGGSRYKCANKQCYKKFSCTIKTVFESTKIPVDKWILLMYIYAKKRGKPSSFDLESGADISAKTTFWVFERLDFIWPFIEREVGESAQSLVVKMIKKSESVYSEYVDLKHSPYYKTPFHISDITDISDVKQYNQLVRYTRYYVNVFCKSWIFNRKFASPEDIISELFLYMKEKCIKEYSGDFILKHLWTTVNRMWGEYIKENPNLRAKYAAKRKECKRGRRVNLSDGYVIQTIKNSKAGKDLSINDIKKTPGLIESKRIQLREKRKKSGRVFDFNSHFS